jgi:hypothetical protein
VSESTPHREPASATVPLDDYNRVVAENAQLRSDDTGAKIGIALTMLVLAFVLWLSYRAVVRGKTWDADTERANAERAAMLYADRIYGHAQVVSVYCGGDTDWGDAKCKIVTNRGYARFTVWCDDDDPKANDGCHDE